MKKFKSYIIISVLIILVLMITACSKNSMQMSSDTATANYTNGDRYDSKSTSSETKVKFGSKSSNSYTTVEKEESQTANVQDNADSSAKADASLTNETAVSFENAKVGIQDKIIRNVSMEVETKKFDSLLKTIDTQIKQLGGYVESSQISGQSYNDSRESRSSNIVARIPKTSLDDFVNKVSDDANVISKEETSQNVTLDYIDVESRKKALTIEQDRLYAILEKADKLDNIITLENRLSDIRYELQKDESQLRAYDNQVDYSTVTININEVERITPVSTVKKTAWDRIRIGFGSSIYQVSEGFKDFFIWFVVNIPYFILWAILIFVVVIICRKVYRKFNDDNSNSKPGNRNLKAGQNDTAATKDKENEIK